MTITTPPAQIPRDTLGRPMVIPPEGGKQIPYTRCTTYVDAVEDKYALQQWMQRMTAIGLVERPELLLAVAAHRDDKHHLNQLCEDALEAAKGKAGATKGTALHALTEQLDRGLELGPVPLEFAPDLAAYTEATQDLKATHIEQFCVLDALKIGGTPDRVVRYQGRTYIADLKTGSIEYGTLKIAMQLAVYARSRTYDPATGERGIHGADLERGIIIHLPAGTGTCTLHWVNLLKGWEGVQVAKQVREKRRLNIRDLTVPFASPSDVDSLVPVLLESLIVACTTPDEVRALWAAHTSEWTDAHTEAAKAHITALQAP